MDAASLSGERATLRALTNGDVPWVAEMNALPEVARWWSPRDPDYLQSKVRDEELACWVVELDGKGGWLRPGVRAHAPGVPPCRP